MFLLVGTENPAKLQGAQKAYEAFFDQVVVQGIPVPSDVPDQPVNEEIYLGAVNRVNHLMQYARDKHIDCDYYAAIESGITNALGRWVSISIAVIKDKTGYESWGTSSAYPVPEQYVNEIIQSDLGKLMRRIFQSDSAREMGGISFLTHGKVNRAELSQEAFTMALTQFINGDAWKASSS